MTDVDTEQRQHNGAGRTRRVLGRRHPRRQPAVAQTGASQFPHVVWAHYQWEQLLHRERDTGQPLSDADRTRLEELEATYRRKLNDFQKEQGKLEQVYWSTRTASAVAMTVKRGPVPRMDPLHLRERVERVRFHRVTDWVTHGAPLVADLMHECDLLASRVEQVLQGTPQRIAMRWILGIAMHLLGFLERDRPEADRAREERDFVHGQRQNLAEVESYYHRAASQAGRIVYVSGMLIGLLFIVVFGLAADRLLTTTDISSHHRNLALLCYASGAIGALVSTISRMGKPEADKFNVDYELGRPLIRRLGVFRPFVGGIFGVALFFLLASGLLELKPTAGLEPYYYGLGAFLAGFSERFATGMLSGAERHLVPVDEVDDESPAPARSPQPRPRARTG